MKTATRRAIGRTPFNIDSITEPGQQIQPERSTLLNNEEAAAYLGVTPRTLEVWRCVKRYNIAYVKVGRLVRYRKSSLDAFLTARTVEA